MRIDQRRHQRVPEQNGPKRNAQEDEQLRKCYHAHRRVIVRWWHGQQSVIKHSYFMPRTFHPELQALRKGMRLRRSSSRGRWPRWKILRHQCRACERQSMEERKHKVGRQRDCTTRPLSNNALSRTQNLQATGLELHQKNASKKYWTFCASILVHVPFSSQQTHLVRSCFFQIRQVRLRSLEHSRCENQTRDKRHPFSPRGIYCKHADNVSKTPRHYHAPRVLTCRRSHS